MAIDAQEPRKPFDPEHPIPGTRSGRMHLIAGLIFLVGILVALVWFSLANTDTHDAAIRLFG